MKRRKLPEPGRSRLPPGGAIPAVLALLLLAAGCGDGFGPEDLFLGTIEVDWAPAEIDVPGTATAGRAFVVTVRTFHNRFCEKVGRTEVAAHDLTATLTPLDRRVALNCPDGGGNDGLHQARIRFYRPGVGTVRVRGWSQLQQDTIVIEQTVRVR